MVKSLRLIVLLLLISSLTKAQFSNRISIASVKDPVFPQWDYSGYLTDDLSYLVPAVSGTGQYSTVIIALTAKSTVTGIALYDTATVVTSSPTYVYSINGADTVLIAKFTEGKTLGFTNFAVPIPIVATQIAVKKFGNWVPQKVQVFGAAYKAGAAVDASPLRIPINSISSSINTGMNFNPWLNDTLTSLVSSVWASVNNQYVDVKVYLPARAQVARVSVYDESGQFTTNPAYIYVQKDTGLIFLAKFEGLLYKQFVDYPIPEGLQADAIVIRKYANNIPQKVQIFGRTLPVDPFAQPRPVPTATPAPASTTTTAPSNTAKPDTGQTFNYAKIPIDSSRWFILNYAPNGINTLFNGITNESANTGFPSWKTNYDCLYPLNDGEVINLSKIKMYDMYGVFTSAPATIFAIKKDGSRVNLATFTGSTYNVWVGPYPDRSTTGQAAFNLDSTITGIKYIGINCTGNNLPSEIEFYGSYTAPTVKATPAISYANFSKTLGTNLFAWDFTKQSLYSRTIAEEKYVAIKNFRGVRNYVDWNQMEPIEDKYWFNPTKPGGWCHDMTYDRCKQDSIEVLLCIQNTPDFMRNGYPDSIRAVDNVPVKYGMSKDSAKSYVEYARMGFQLAARYGRNPNVPTALLTVVTTPRWNSDPPNQVKVGLGTVRYIECGNELDKWWKGPTGYLNCYQAAAMLSAFYDGNMGTLGNNAGVKTADTTMQVVMAGLANSDPSYIRGMIEWCRNNRGYKADGTINLCWDVINFHYYSTDAGKSQTASSTRGMAPDVSSAAVVARSFVALSKNMANGIPVWVTELGFDINQGSPMKAIPIGNKTASQTQADWALRSCLTYLREGVSNLFFYQLNDANLSNSQQFSSMGLTDSVYQRKPELDYMYQTNKLLGNFHFNRNLQQAPIVDEYVNNGQSIYAVWVADEKGTTLPCSLSFANTDSVMVYQPVIGGEDLLVQTIAVVNGVVQLTASETPVFVMAKPSPPGMYVRLNGIKPKIPFSLRQHAATANTK